METVKELFEDPKIQLRMMQSALKAVTSHFTPSKMAQSAGDDGSGSPNLISGASTHNNKAVTDINKESNTYEDRLALELNNFKNNLKLRAKLRLIVQSKI